jgi:hypothetical protein
VGGDDEKNTLLEKADLTDADRASGSASSRA